MPEQKLNLAALLAPIPGDKPAGESLPFAIKNDLEEKRKEIDPEAYKADDPQRPTEAKLADWSGIIEVATETLTSKSKDLLTAARLTEALTKERGFTGLADGLALMKGIITECWDRCHPDISDGDLDVRAGPFNWLSDTARGALFPNTVRSVPIVMGPSGRFGWRDWKLIGDPRGPKKDSFDQALLASSRDDCELRVKEIERAIAEYKGIVDALAAKIGPEAPTLIDLRGALSDCLSLSQMILKEKGPAALASSSEADAAAGAAPGAAAAPPPKPAAPTRDDIYAQLMKAADQLEKLEPHSPIPYLLKRAHELGAMKFPDLLKVLFAEGSTLKTVQKEFGLKEPEPAKK